VQLKKSTSQKGVGMELEKWYGDVVVGDEVRIFYRARLTWGLLRLGYAAEMSPDGRFTHRWLSSRLPMPHAQKETWVWPTERPEPIVWTPSPSSPLQPHAPELLLWQDPRTGDGVRWQPLVCAGTVQGLHGGPSGRGYVERLCLSVSPWALGLRVLHWGRFCGQRHSMVWIKWQGLYPRAWVLVDAALGGELTVLPQAVQTPQAVVTWTTPRTLVQERLSAGPLHHLQQRLTRKPDDLWAFLNATQHKCHAPAVWQGADGEQEDGHVVYEEVVWH
jgi:hypothetical protein